MFTDRTYKEETINQFLSSPGFRSCLKEFQHALNVESFFYARRHSLRHKVNRMGFCHCKLSHLTMIWYFPGHSIVSFLGQLGSFYLFLRKHPTYCVHRNKRVNERNAYGTLYAENQEKFFEEINKLSRTNMLIFLE